MGKKLTKEEFETRVKNISNDTIDVSEFDFQGTQCVGVCKCKICGYMWTPKAYSILQGHGCRKCYDKRNSEQRIIDLSEIQERINKNGAECIIIDGYVDTKHKCDAKCNKCGYIWRPWVNDLLRGHGCPKCSSKRNGIKERLNYDEYINRCNEMYDDAYDLSELNYTLMKNNVYPICKKHGKFEINAYQFLKGCGCKKCRMSKGQRELGIFLKKNNVQFYEEYNKFKWLTRGKSGRMSFDFYLPTIKTAIEYQGRQHFEEVNIFGGEDGLKITIERDKYKKNACKENNVKLLYFLPKEYTKYMDEDDLYFTDENKLIKYIQIEENKDN